MRKQTTEESLKWVITALGVGMLAGVATCWLLYGFSLRKLIIGLAGLLFFTAGRIGSRAVGVYKDIAIIMLNSLVLLLMLEGGAALVLRFVSSSDVNDDGPAYYKTQESGARYSLETEQAENRRYVPYVIWKDAPFVGEYINVDHDGNRVTPGVRCAGNSYVVFMFGGSAMWGSKVPDWGTIPAYFQTEVSSLGDRPICVRNFGQKGWVSTQSVIELLRHLQAGEMPNLVIFYDGFNEVAAAMEAGVAGAHDGMAQVSSRLQRQGPNPVAQLAIRTSVFELTRRFVPSLTSPRRPDQPVFETTSLGNAITQTYLTNYRVVKALAAQFSFDYAFFCQPNLLYEEKPLTNEEKTILGRRAEPLRNFSELMKIVYAQIQSSTRTSDHLFFLADAFKNETEWLYISEVHLTPGGNQKIARRMAETLLSNHFLREPDLRLSSVGNQ